MRAQKLYYKLYGCVPSAVVGLQQENDIGDSRRGNFGGSPIHSIYGFDLFANGTNVYGSKSGELGEYGRCKGSKL